MTHFERLCAIIEKIPEGDHEKLEPLIRMRQQYNTYRRFAPKQTAKIKKLYSEFVEGVDEQ